MRKPDSARAIENHECRNSGETESFVCFPARVEGERQGNTPLLDERAKALRRVGTGIARDHDELNVVSGLQVRTHTRQFWRTKYRIRSTICR